MSLPKPPLTELLLRGRSRRAPIAWVVNTAFLAACWTASDQPDPATDTTAAATTTIEAAYHRPVFSPSGDQIVFMEQSPSTGGDWELFRMATDGSGVVRLTTHRGWDGYAVWSPDGTRLVFDRDDGERTTKYPVLLELASGVTQRVGDFDGRLSVNSWSPDGALLYGFWEKEGQRDLYAVTLAGEIVERLTDTPDLSEHEAQVSPDGTLLAFAVERVDGNGSGIATLDLATKRRRTLLESSGRIYGLAFSPDGRTLAYTDNPAGGDDDAEIFVLDLASGASLQLTDNADYDHMPVFHPSGAYLLFTSYRSGTERIYSLRLSDGAVAPF